MPGQPRRLPGSENSGRLPGHMYLSQRSRRGTGGRGQGGQQVSAQRVEVSRPDSSLARIWGISGKPTTCDTGRFPIPFFRLDRVESRSRETEYLHSPPLRRFSIYPDLACNYYIYYSV